MPMPKPPFAQGAIAGMTAATQHAIAGFVTPVVRQHGYRERSKRREPNEDVR